MKVLNHQVKCFFQEVYKPSEVAMFNDFYDWRYDWENFNINSHNFKYHFFNYTAKEYINYIQKSNEKTFLVIGKPEDAYILEFVDYEQFYHAYFLNMRKLMSLLPMNAIIVEDSFKNFMNDDNEELHDLLTNEILECKERNLKKKYNKLKSFLNTYELRFLNKSIFKDIHNKFVFHL